MNKLSVNRIESNAIELTLFSQRLVITKEDIVRMMLVAIGENPERPGLKETPDRVVRSWAEMFAGYKQDPKIILKMFAQEGERYDEMIVVRNIEFTSYCEHHLMPFEGFATIGYIPRNKGIVGLSKMGRLVDCFAKRLQVQERLTTEIADAMYEHVSPDVGVQIYAKHSCMRCRGVKKQNSDMLTSAVRGVFKTDPITRGEFLRLAAVKEQS